MSNSMIERVARALLIRRLGPTPFPPPMLATMPLMQFGGWHDAMDAARAAIEAMLEPTKVMIEAGITAADECKDSDWDSGPDGESHNSYEYLRSDAPQQIFEAMIDAALNEQPRPADPGIPVFSTSPGGNLQEEDAYHGPSEEG